MIKRLALALVLVSFAGVSTADASHTKKHLHPGNGAPDAWVVSCLMPKGNIEIFKTKGTPETAIQLCLASGGHPVGVAPIHSVRK